MTLKQRQPMLAPNMIDGITTAISEPGTGVTVIDQAKTVRRARLTLTDFSVAVAEADDYGGTKVLDLPDSNLMLLAVEVNLVMTKAGTTNGLVAATDVDVAIGTAVASNAVLSSTMIDVIEKADLNADTLTGTWQAHSADQATATFPLQIADGAASALYLNMAAAITADDTATFDGTIDITYIDLGNDAS